MTFQRDRFFTPPRLAKKLTEAVGFQSVQSCADPNCGHGQLLLSAEARWPKARYWGLDIDRRAVRTVLRRRPQWHVSVGDLLSRRSLVRTQVFRTRERCDVLLTNPPFSMGVSKGVVLSGAPYRCSVAMAHILAAIELCRPKYAIGAIVPESLLHSELDDAARCELSATWHLEEILCVPQGTFDGTRAHATMIVLRRSQCKDGAEGGPRVRVCGDVTADLVRGGLPVHATLLAGGSGLPFVHSTDLTPLVNGSYQERRVCPIGRGCVVGAVILLPRVGVPSLEHLAPLQFERPVQLSDCVIGLRFSSHGAAASTAKVMRAEWETLVSLYKGTGARYITMQRVTDWFRAVGIEVNKKRHSIGNGLAGG